MGKYTYTLKKKLYKNTDTQSLGSSDQIHTGVGVRDATASNKHLDIGDICLNRQTYLLKLQNVFVELTKYICPNYKFYMDAVRSEQHLWVLINWERLKKLCKRFLINYWPTSSSISKREI